MLISVSIVRGKDACIQYGIIVAKDITYQKALEHELKIQQANLISFDRKRTLNEMAVGLVHELGQPVTALTLQVDQLVKSLEENDKLLNPIQTQIDEMGNQLGKISGFIGRLRGYAQSVERVNRSSVDINCAVDAAIAMVEYKYKEAGIELIVEKASALPKVTAHQPELEQVLVNLLNNAREAYDSQDTNVRENPKQVRLVTTSESDKFLVICIYDLAGGIPLTLHKRIFDPFYSTKDAEMHTGTGLFTARNNINSLGGDISVQRFQDVGSLFVIRIPFPEQEERKQLINLIEMLHHPYLINHMSKQLQKN